MWQIVFWVALILTFGILLIISIVVGISELQKTQEDVDPDFGKAKHSEPSPS